SRFNDFHDDYRFFGCRNPHLNRSHTVSTAPVSLNSSQSSVYAADVSSNLSLQSSQGSSNSCSPTIPTVTSVLSVLTAAVCVPALPPIASS
ncbi:hypothetical protein PENTCL1PPCAC_13356, partial [Pristionchus entomophagus]